MSAPAEDDVGAPRYGRQIDDANPNKRANAGAHQKRHEILLRSPQLLSRQMAQMTNVTEQLTRAVQTILSSTPRWGGVIDASTAEMMLGTCFSGVRIAVKEWIAAGSHGSAQELEQRTIALIRQQTERIA